MEIVWARIKEILELTREESGASSEYARGAIIGTVASFMALGFTHNQAWRELIKLMPDDFRVSAIPTSWVIKDEAVDGWSLPFDKLVSYQTLLEALPEEMKAVESIDDHGMTCRDVLLDRYLYVMAILQREQVRALPGLNPFERLKNPDIVCSFRPFSKAGSQFITDWAVSDMRKQRKESYNWHLQNTSRWLYAGCLLVQDGRVSIHT